MEIDVVVKELQVAGGFRARAWKFNAMVITDNAGVINLLGTPTKDPIFSTSGGGEDAWDVSVNVASTPARLTVTCTGEDATVLGWTMSARLTEVYGYYNPA
jgi:hypothetical protein